MSPVASSLWSFPDAFLYFTSQPTYFLTLAIFLLLCRSLPSCFYSVLRSAFGAKSRGDAGHFPLCTPLLVVTSGPKLVKLLKSSLHLEGLVMEAWSVSQISLSEMIGPWDK